MADIGNPVGGVGVASPARPPNAAHTAAVRTAQRAFFEAALGGVQAAQPVADPSAKLAPPVAVQPVRVDLDTPPNRILRPGSLVDIKV